MKEITLREIIRETQEAIDRGQTYGDVEKCTRLLNRLKQLEKRIEDAKAFLKDNNIGSASSLTNGIVFALKKILGE
ncbi:hypothetical protein ES703_38828 [subsurface metagenome]